MPNFPQHIAIIMDGNGRWASERGLKRTAGHEEGAKVVRNISEHCTKIGIKYLTLFAFSTENWARPKLEVNYLLKLLEKYLQNELDNYLKNNLRFLAIGDLSKFPQSLQDIIKLTEEKTSNCTGLTQLLALNYGSKDEITRAVKKIIEKNLELSEENISKHLDTANIPEVDILIRTGSEVRLSNFLLWQCAYAEMFFIKKYWPEFSTYDIDDIIDDFGRRERRFGGI